MRQKRNKFGPAPTQQAIYVIGPKNGPYKVGRSAMPYGRMKDLQIGHAQILELHFSKYWHQLGSSALETAIHHQLDANRLNGEWFDLPLKEIIRNIEAVAYKMVLELVDQQIRRREEPRMECPKCIILRQRIAEMEKHLPGLL